MGDFENFPPVRLAGMGFEAGADSVFVYNFEFELL